jgi:hypothetical protein
MSKELCDTNRCHSRVGDIDRRSLIPLLGAGAAFLMLAGKALAQQVPNPACWGALCRSHTATAASWTLPKRRIVPIRWRVVNFWGPNERHLVL